MAKFNLNKLYVNKNRQTKFDAEKRPNNKHGTKLNQGPENCPVLNWKLKRFASLSTTHPLRSKVKNQNSNSKPHTTDVSHYKDSIITSKG